MSVIPASIRETQANGRRLGELLGIPSEGAAARTRRFQETRALPLVAVSVRARIVADCAVTELEERFANGSAEPMDVTHTIPLPPEGAVTAFQIASGGRVAKGICKRTEEAKADYDSAARRGKTAALLDSVRDDVHVISLANVPPKSEIVVRLTIIERLRVDDGRFEYRFPTTISPKYVPGDGLGHEGSGTSADTDRAPDASRLTPPVRLDGGTLLDLEIALPADATDLSASMPLVRNTSPEGLLVLRPDATARCTRDVVVRAWSRGTEPVARAYSDGERTLVVVDPPARRRPELECPREAVFVLDRSGSMAGPRLAAAKRALVAALRGLGDHDTFEVIAFESGLTTFSSEPVSATKANVTAASAWLDAIEAAGGTEALQALERACIRRVGPGRVRTVLFLTDGDVGNDFELLDLVRRFDPAVRLFTIGIGLGPSAGLLARLARIGGGTNLSIEDSQDVEAEIRRFESALAGPMACGLGAADARRSSGRDLFAGRSTTFFIDGARENVELTSVDGRFRASARVTRSPIPLGALWARDRVAELEDRLLAEPSQRGLIEPEIAELGVRHQIQTRLTSFVAIDEASQVHGEPIVVVQPTDAPEDVHLTRAFRSVDSKMASSRGPIAARDARMMSRIAPSADACMSVSLRTEAVGSPANFDGADLRSVVRLLLDAIRRPSTCSEDAAFRALARLDELADAARDSANVELFENIVLFRMAVRAMEVAEAERLARLLVGELSETDR